MKLYYWKGPKGFENFGDDLNPWIFSRICPQIFDDNEESLFVGIGSILNDQIPPAKKVLVFSSGAGYSNVPKIDSSWKIYCVRGLLTAQALGLSSDYAVTDGAVLVKRLIAPWSRKIEHKISYMPHMLMAQESGGAFKDICDDLGINYIDPQLDIEGILKAILNSEKIITEALHGAVVADAVCVPWLRVRTNDFINDFKWNDWQSSLDLDVKPVQLFPVWKLPMNSSCFQQARRLVKKTLLAQHLKKIKRRDFLLSDEVLLEEKEKRLYDILNQFINENQNSHHE